MIKNKEPVETTIVHRLVFIYTRYSVLKVLEPHPACAHQWQFCRNKKNFMMHKTNEAVSKLSFCHAEFILASSF